MITVQVMAVSNMSAANQNPVGIALKRPQDMMGRDGCRAHDADGPYIGWILHPAHSGQVGSAIGAPVTHKSDYFRFKFFYFHRTTPY